MLLLRNSYLLLHFTRARFICSYISKLNAEIEATISVCSRLVFLLCCVVLCCVVLFFVRSPPSCDGREKALSQSQLPLVRRAKKSVPNEVVFEDPRSVIYVELDVMHIVVDRREVLNAVVPKIVPVAPMSSDRCEDDRRPEERELRLVERHEDRREKRREVQHTLDGVERQTAPHVSVN